MKTYTIQRKPTDLDWTRIPIASLDNQPWMPEVDIAATAQICYDESALYLRLTAKESQIRAEGTGLLDMPSEDSCLEFFFSPISNDSRYFSLEFNPNCCMFLGIGSGRKDLTRLLPTNQNMFCPHVQMTLDGWEITYQIPRSFICQFFPDFVKVSGKKMRANFFKCGDLTVQSHYLTWNKVTSDTPDFHRSSDFGVLEFA